MNTIKKILKNPDRYNKFIVALGAAFAQLIIVMAPTETDAAFFVTSTELYTVLVAFAAAVGVERVANAWHPKR